MSTRSGKRIHASVDSPNVTDIVLKSQQKTRSKKVKENIDSSIKHRHNYVSYPNYEDTASDTVDNQEKVRRTGRSRRNTLKEHNSDRQVLSNIELNEEHKSVRKTRRGKKKIEESENAGDLENVLLKSKSIAIVKKKGKKKTNYKMAGLEPLDVHDIENQILMTKGNKKKRTNSFVISIKEKKQNETELLNNCNMSVDSFHSAAGSPVIGEVSEIFYKKKANSIEHDIEDHHASYLETTDLSTVFTLKSAVGNEKEPKKTRKSCVKNSTYDKIDAKDGHEESFNIAYKIKGLIAEFGAEKDASEEKRMKSHTKNCSFDKVTTDDVEESNLNGTIDKTEDVANVCNTQSNILTRKRRKSSIKNLSFETIAISTPDQDNLNTTFDKIAEITTEFNMKVDGSVRRRKKSNSNVSSYNQIETKHEERNIANTCFNTTEDVSNNCNTKASVLSRNSKKYSIKNSTVDKIKTGDTDRDNLNTTYEKLTEIPTTCNMKVNLSTTTKKRKASLKNSNLDNVETKSAGFNFSNSIIYNNSSYNDNLAEVKSPEGVDIDDEHYNDSLAVFNTTVNKSRNKKNISNVTNCSTDTVEKDSETCETKEANVTFDKGDMCPQNLTFDKESSHTNDYVGIPLLNISNINVGESMGSIKTVGLRNAKDNIQLNTTFDNEKEAEMTNDSTKSSSISSDAAMNVTFDKSDNNSRISITSDESRTENILNHTPVLVESSIDESGLLEDKTALKPIVPLTPLKRESTFTKDGPDVITCLDPKPTLKTPSKRKSSPGHTPYPISKSSQKEKNIMNITRSIEKSSVAETGPRQTRVLFCSPVNNHCMASQMKRRVIKSSLKGSSKSFVFDDSVSCEVRQGQRKRSLTVGETETRAKRKRLADDLQHSVNRLSRPRTVSATAKLPDPGTPKKFGTPSKAKPDSKVSRTKLPNFAALHQKQFEKMESLDECQERKAKRARQLLTPTGNVGIQERISPKGTPPKSAPPAKDLAVKLHTPSKRKILTLESLNPGYTRFGFKLKMDDNPFSVAGRTDVKDRPSGLSRKTTCLTLPSLEGATLTRRDTAKQTVMREKSFTDKRDTKRKETRTVIKGVRTNRRFELQMKMRNING